VTLHVAGEIDPRFGWILDFAEIDAAWAPVFERLDHRYLNEVSGLDNPTSELIARYILEQVRLPAGRLTAVSVGETCATAVTVRAD
jgi:6-pyruvoyltetrahydropterin/6-carboxytetrahydropterin synthase